MEFYCHLSKRYLNCQKACSIEVVVMASPAEHSEIEAASSRCNQSVRASCQRENRPGAIQCSEDNEPCPGTHAATQEADYPYKIIPLIEGYSENQGPGKQLATGSSTLVKGLKNVIVDTGNPSDKDKLLRALDEKGHVSPSEIDYVVCTHGHSDHVGNLNLFPDATFIVSYDVSKKDEYTIHSFRDGTPYKIDEGLEVVPTPGHSGNDVTVIVEDTRYGVVAITGDLFEKEEDLQQEALWKQYSENIQQQKESREKILRKADFIVPGHGKMFRNTKK